MLRWVVALCFVLIAPQLAAAQAAQAAQAAPPSAAPTRVSLREAIELALRREPRLEVAKAEIARAEALARQAHAASYPTLDGNAVYTRLDHERRFNGRTVAGVDALSANLVLQVPLVAPRRWAQAAHSTDNVEIAKRDGDDVRRQVAVAVAYAYLAVVAQHRAGEVAQRAVDTAKAHYEYAHTRFAGGVGNRLDDVRASQEMAVSEAQLEGARAGLARATEGLAVLLGADGPVDATDDVALPEVPTLAQGLTQATEGRSDVLAQNERVRVAERTVGAAWTDYMPLLLAQFQPFYQNPASITQPTTGWQAQLILSVPLYDGGMRYGLQDERDALAAKSHSERDAILRQAKSEVRVAFAVLERADAGLAAATKAAQLASEALDMITQAYKAGATSNLELIDAERRARDAATTAVIAEDEARRARVELLVATGRLP